ncbi:MAG: hypothetical protein AAFY22_05165 [Pseudomonadota bacterium]
MRDEPCAVSASPKGLIFKVFQDATKRFSGAPKGLSPPCFYAAVLHISLLSGTTDTLRERTKERERTMAKFVSALIGVSVIVIALAPAAYTAVALA